MNNRRLLTVALLSLLVVGGFVCRGSAEERPLAADLVRDGQLIDIHSARYRGLFKELRLQYDFSQSELEALFGGVTIKRRVLELMDTQWEARPYYQYFPRFVTTAMVREGQWMLEQHRRILDAVEREMGVERAVVVAIWGIETRFGKHKGAFNLFQTLNTMFDAYPRRRNFYRKQLIHFLLLCRENGVKPDEVTGSYGGAFGQTQFIPSSFREYAVDFDHDGKRDVWQSIPDVLGSIANYLHRYGWQFGEPVYQDIGGKLKGKSLQAAYAKGRKGYLSRSVIAQAQGVTLPPTKKDRFTIVGLELDAHSGMRYVAGFPNFQAITAWNHSNRYAMAVTELAEKIGGRPLGKK